MKNTRQKIYEEPQDYDTMEPMDTMNLMEVVDDMDPIDTMDVEGEHEESSFLSNEVKSYRNSIGNTADTQQQVSFSEDSIMETTKRNLLDEYDKNNTVIPPAGNSLDEEEALRLLEQVQEEEEIMDDDALLELVNKATEVENDKPFFNSHSTEVEDNIEKLLKELSNGIFY